MILSLCIASQPLVSERISGDRFAPYLKTPTTPGVEYLLTVMLDKVGLHAVVCFQNPEDDFSDEKFPNYAATRSWCTDNTTATAITHNRIMCDSSGAYMCRYGSVALWGRSRRTTAAHYRERENDKGRGTSDA